MFLQLGLHQCVSTPTHLTSSGDFGSLLDLVLVSNRHAVEKVCTHPPLGKSDHLVVSCQLDTRRRVPNSSADSRRQIWMYDQADFEKINRLLSRLDRSKVSTATNIDPAWDAWKDLFFSVVSKEVPSRFVSHSRHKLPWMNAKLRELIRQKHGAWNAWKRSSNPLHLSAFKNLHNKVNSALRAVEKQFLRTLHREMNILHHSDSIKSFGTTSSKFLGRSRRPAFQKVTVLNSGSHLSPRKPGF